MSVHVSVNVRPVRIAHCLPVSSMPRCMCDMVEVDEKDHRTGRATDSMRAYNEYLTRITTL